MQRAPSSILAKMFRDVLYPAIKDFATFANGNWDGACMKAMRAIGVFSDDRTMFDRAVKYYFEGSGNGAITHYVVCIPLCTALVLVAAASGGAAEWFVAPGGRADGSGTAVQPWPLVPTLEGKMPVRPGDTVWLLGGTYRLPGSAGPRGVTATLRGVPERPVIVRARHGERVRIEGELTVNGERAWYWGFEISGGGVTVTGPHTKLINLDIHGGDKGIGHWTPARDSEVYGCIVHDFGRDGPGRGHGHALYIQNEHGEKRIVDNVFFRGFGMNLHAYTQSGSLKGLHVEGNISFAAGVRKPGQVFDAYLISGYTPADRIALLDNVAYHAGGRRELGGGWRPIARVDNYKNLLNGTCTVQGNYLAGARGLLLGKWRQAEVTGNTLWSDQLLASVRPPDDGSLSAYSWNGNRYISTSQRPRFAVVGSDGFAEKASQYLDFEAWRARTGFDGQSELVRLDRPRPEGTVVVVRPNRYEERRAHVAVFNWDEKEAVDLDLSGVLTDGDRYRVHNVQVNTHDQPVASGTFSRGAVRVPTLRSEIAPHFEAYLVVGDR